MTDELKARRLMKKFVEDCKRGVPFKDAVLALCDRKAVDEISDRIVELIDTAEKEGKQHGDIALALAMAIACYGKSTEAPEGSMESLLGVAIQLVDEAVEANEKEPS